MSGFGTRVATIVIDRVLPVEVRNVRIPVEVDNNPAVEIKNTPLVKVLDGEVLVKFPSLDQFNNAEKTYEYDVNENPIKVEATVDGVLYRKIYTWDAQGNCTNISKWTKV